VLSNDRADITHRHNQEVMRIIGIVNQTSGPCYHRVYTPLMLMDGVDCHITNKITEEQLEKGCDVLVMNRFSFYNQPDEIFELRDKYKFKLVIDIDDIWQLNDNHILASYWEHFNVENVIIDNMIKADAVTCTHWRLAERVHVYNQNAFILPNAIPGGFEQFNIDKVASDRVRLFYQGSTTHRQDVEILRNPMKRVYGDSQLAGKVQSVFAGHVPGMIDSDSMLSALSMSLKTNPLIIPGTSPKDYYQCYNYADIALIPLIFNKFNTYKSNLKILESAFAGIPVIVSHVDPYLDFPEDLLFYVKRQSDWYEYIRYLTDNEHNRLHFGTQLMDYCYNNYNFKTINETRKQIYESI